MCLIDSIVCCQSAVTLYIYRAVGLPKDTRIRLYLIKETGQILSRQFRPWQSETLTSEANWPAARGPIQVIYPNLRTLIRKPECLTCMCVQLAIQVGSMRQTRFLAM
jgi:hypothetical protein